MVELEQKTLSIWMSGQSLRIQLLILVLVGFLCMVASSHAKAEENELSLKQMLLSPGELTQAHAKIETQCESCHVHFEKSNQTPLCLECHEKIQQDLSKKIGFHGLMSEEKIKDCKSCHTDHKGRDFDISGLDMDNFDHSLTNFKLDGSHLRLSCSSCHRDQQTVKSGGPSLSLPESIHTIPTDKAFRLTEFECESCHVDFHQNEKTNECASCHNTRTWSDSKFDHSKTEFPLDGGHEKLECSNCHVGNQFESLDTQCQSCHLAKDSHLGVFGQKCDDCHKTQEWDNQPFDHFKKTGFVLRDSHVKVAGKSVQCIDCHSEKLNPETKCIGCHLEQDVHQGSNGQICQDCHNQKSWNTTDFVHNKNNTGFELTGSHRSESCDSCHLPGIKKNTITTGIGLGLIRSCIDCHQAIDPHFSKLGRDCGSCHQTESWQSDVKFNHDFSDFPLNGSHQLLVCESCHVSTSFSEQTSACIDCHKKDDVHNESLGQECETCHDTSVWSHWQFDHQQQTTFSLNGAHQNLQCNLCHTQELRDPLKPGKDCYSCHRQDDTHNGGFGMECQQCHSEESFEELDL